MNILRLPPTTILKTKVNYRPVYFGYPLGNASDHPVADNVFTGVQNWLEIVVANLQDFNTLIIDIDLTSESRFWSYEESDISWLIYCNPNRLTNRAPRDREIVSVSIEGRKYKAHIEVPYFSCRASHIIVKAHLIYQNTPRLTTKP